MLKHQTQLDGIEPDIAKLFNALKERPAEKSG
jgi:hypothetical protein